MTVKYDYVAECKEYLVETIANELEGWTIQCPIQNSEGCVGMVVKKGNQQKIVWINSDEEGNDVGWISVTNILKDPEKFVQRIDEKIKERLALLDKIDELDPNEKLALLKTL